MSEKKLSPLANQKVLDFYKSLPFNYYSDINKQKSGLGLGIFIGKNLLEKNFESINCRNSKTRSGAEVNIKWKNKELFNI